MQTKLKSGKEHESAPEAAEYDDAAESSLVLHAVLAALPRLNYACRVVIHTECGFVAAAIAHHWAEEWQAKGWKNSKGKDVKDALLWDMVLQEVEEAGHELAAEAGKHEWSDWMRWKLPLASPLKNVFKKLEKDLQN